MVKASSNESIAEVSFNNFSFLTLRQTVQRREFNSSSVIIICERFRTKIMHIDRVSMVLPAKLTNSINDTAASWQSAPIA